MKKTRKAASNVNNAVNLISGAYTLPLLDKLFSNSQRIEDMDDIYFSITALVDTDRISEAFYMIRGLFGLPVWNIRRRSHSWKDWQVCRNLLCLNLFLIFMT